MKFLYADTQDYVDPEYDFIADRNAPGRRRYWDDQYAHELMSSPPYDGLLVSMSALRQADGVANSKVRYSTAEEQRFLRVGARKFLRLDGAKFRHLMIMGDCGAFAYVEHDKPAYEPSEVVEFYEDAGFTHGVSPDHIIFECDLANPPARTQSKVALERYQVTLDNAAEFIKLARQQDAAFEPMGAVQGWSPQSMAEAARKLEGMGYRYLAIGGLVPLKVDAIHQVLDSIRAAIKPSTNIHLLGFAKADYINDFVRHDVTSFDSTSPLIQAFKDAKKNYYMRSPEGGLAYYSAIRIPQAIENPRLMQGIKRGIFHAEDLQKLEQKALDALRGYDRGERKLKHALDAVLAYQKFMILGNGDSAENHEKEFVKMQSAIERTLQDQPWKKCQCAICAKVGVEVIIFRSSNRNKRRGFHNLGVYYENLQRTIGQ